MRIKAVPIREKIADYSGFVSVIWNSWLDSLVIRLNSGDGITDTFTTTDGKTVTVVDGIITEIT